MKNLLFFTILVFSTAIINAQTKQPINDHSPLKTKKHGLPVEKSLIWQWDTIIAYDTSNLSQRLTRTFDANGNAIIQMIDYGNNGSWYNGNKDSMSYDMNGNMLTDYTWWADTNNILTFYSRATFTYNLSGKVLTQLNEVWQSNTWVNSVRYSYTYDGNGNMLTETRESWQTNVWVNLYRETYTYDGNGNKLTYLTEQWLSGAWVNVGSNSYTYDGNGNMLTNTYEQWQSGAWVNGRRDTYTYDGNGNMLTDLSEEGQAGIWVNYFRGTMTYDGSGNNLTVLGEEWQTNTWVNNYRYTNTFSGIGNLLTQLHEIWQGGKWANNNRYTYSYDGNGFLLSELGEIWQTGTWVNDEKYSYTNDAYGNSLTGQLDYWMNGVWHPWINQYLGVLCQNNDILDLQFVHRYVASYVSFTSGIENNDLNKNSFTIFPNPATIFLTIDGLTTSAIAEIYDLSGKLILKSPLLKPQIDVSNLSKGMYFIKLSTKEGSVVRKFVKE